VLYPVAGARPLRATAVGGSAPDVLGPAARCRAGVNFLRSGVSPEELGRNRGGRVCLSFFFFEREKREEGRTHDYPFAAARPINWASL
jgi:hypothetical protein